MSDTSCGSSKGGPSVAHEMEATPPGGLATSETGSYCEENGVQGWKPVLYCERGIAAWRCAGGKCVEFLDHPTTALRHFARRHADQIGWLCTQSTRVVVACKR